MIDQNYTGKNVLITGAASGIGQAQMLAYLEAGATVYALDKQVITHDHPALTAWQIYLADTRALDKWLADTQSILATIDVFLSTAGVLDNFTPALEMDMAAYHQLMQINLHAPIQLTLAILPFMKERQAGSIVYMASIAGMIAGGGGSAYTTSKHALVGWMRQLAVDYAPSQVHINAIAPGAIETPMNAADFAGEGIMAQEVAAQTPAKRWAQPEEVANLTLYLTSPQAQYIQGQVLPIDGGWTVQ